MSKPTDKCRKFDDLCDKHLERFGVPYGLNFFDAKSLDEHIKILEDALKSGVPAKNDVPDPDDKVVI